ncbi:hypothetical protein L1277_001236 [Okibacterium sp. HSC-33S16]|nr:hypothetical protein [Okibacterium sp. HSC-33S16]
MDRPKRSDRRYQQCRVNTIRIDTFRCAQKQLIEHTIRERANMQAYDVDAEFARPAGNRGIPPSPASHPCFVL